ncbi:abortive phage infection protein, partial [Bifidobacteriaceae bacterium NR020]
LESKGETYRNEIAYKDNEDKRIPISDLLRLMYAFNIDLFKDDTNAPIASYSGKAIVFKNYSEEYNKYESSNPDDVNDSKEKNIYYLLAQELPVLVRLFELIQKDMGQKYKGYKIDNNQKSAFGKIRGVKTTDKAKTSYHCEDIKYDIPSGYIMPI